MFFSLLDFMKMFYVQNYHKKTFWKSPQFLKKIKSEITFHTKVIHDSLIEHGIFVKKNNPLFYIFKPN